MIFLFSPDSIILCLRIHPMWNDLNLQFKQIKVHGRRPLRQIVSVVVVHEESFPSGLTEHILAKVLIERSDGKILCSLASIILEFVFRLAYYMTSNFFLVHISQNNTQCFCKMILYLVSIVTTFPVGYLSSTSISLFSFIRWKHLLRFHIKQMMIYRLKFRLFQFYKKNEVIWIVNKSLLNFIDICHQ